MSLYELAQFALICGYLTVAYHAFRRTSPYYHLDN